MLECKAAREAASEAAKHAEEHSGGAAGPVELDEFGRDISMEGNEENAGRLERRRIRDLQWKVLACL